MSLDKVRGAAETWMQANPRFTVAVADDYTLTITKRDDGTQVTFALADDLRKATSSATLIRHAIAKHVMRFKSGA